MTLQRYQNLSEEPLRQPDDIERSIFLICEVCTALGRASELGSALVKAQDARDRAKMISLVAEMLKAINQSSIMTTALDSVLIRH